MAINIIQATHTTNTTASSGRSILYIVEHYTAGTTSKSGTARDLADGWFCKSEAASSADFIVDDSNIVQYNPDPANRYCWAVGGSNYGNKGGSLYGIAKNANCINIEICSTNSTGKVTEANDKYWSFTDAVLAQAKELTLYLMDKYNIDIDHVIRHYDVNGKPCPGVIGWNADSGNETAWQAFKTSLGASETKYYRVRLSWDNEASQIGAYVELDNAKAACLPGYTVYDWGGNAVYTNTTSGTQASVFVGLDETTAAEKILNICAPIAISYGLFPSVCAAQTILESGFCTTELAQSANNVCGMKCTLSGNTWSGTTWDGSSKVTIKTAEQDANGNEYYINADFRKYPCIEDSIADRCAYLLGAMNGSSKRYAGITDCKDYVEQITLIKNGGYATDVNYISKICNIIERYTTFSMTMYDSYVKTGAGTIGGGTDDTKWYRVRTSWAAESSQIGAFIDLDNAIACSDANADYNVYDWNGECVHESANQIKYRVQAGAFEKRANANTQVTNLGKAGFEAFVFEEDNLYKVQAGAYADKSLAKKQVKALKKAGFDAFIK